MVREIILLSIGAIFGLGTTMSALAAPSYFPNTAPWVWHWLFWGGVALMGLLACDVVSLIFWRPRLLAGLLANIGLLFLVAAVIAQFSPAAQAAKSTVLGQANKTTLSISGPHLLQDRRYINKNQWRMRVHNAGSEAARNVQMKLRGAVSQPKDTRWGADYPYFVYPVGTIMSDAGHLSRPERQINPNDYENYEITTGWKSEGGPFFTSVNTKGGGHNDIQIQPGERWQFFYDVTAENADPLSFTLHIFLETDQVKVSKVS